MERSLHDSGFDITEFDLFPVTSSLWLSLFSLSGCLGLNGLHHCYSCHSDAGGSIVNNFLLTTSRLTKENG